MTIYDLINSQEIASFWNVLSEGQAPYMGEELFPAEKKRGLDLRWIKGSKGLPVMLKTSAFDVKAIPRTRIGFDKLSAQMPYFKESTVINEEDRQELNMVLETGNQPLIDSVMNKIFDDEMDLIKGAAAAREAMRMMALTTGAIYLESNGQQFSYDYGVTNKENATVDWDESTATPIEDIRALKEAIENATGTTITRAICSGKTMGELRNHDSVKKAIYILSNGQGIVSEAKLKEFLLSELQIEVVKNDKKYVDAAGNEIRYVPEDTFIMFPDGPLGKTWFGTTPAESDLLTSKVANVSIVDTGVAITTSDKVDPVTVETIVSQICLPSFEQADKVGILSTRTA